MLINFLLKKTLAQQLNGFEKVKDIVRGTITTNLGSLFDAYSHFKETPGV